MAYWHHNGEGTLAIKREFRTDARERLCELAGFLGFAKGTYTIKYIAGRHAACGTLTLRHEQIRVHIGHTALGGWEIRVAPGGLAGPQTPDHFQPLYLLNDIEALALRVRNLMPESTPDSATGA